MVRLSGDQPSLTIDEEALHVRTNRIVYAQHGRELMG